VGVLRQANRVAYYASWGVGIKRLQGELATTHHARFTGGCRPRRAVAVRPTQALQTRHELTTLAGRLTDKKLSDAGLGSGVCRPALVSSLASLSLGALLLKRLAALGPGATG
jgi:hypothetical protein